MKPYIIGLTGGIASGKTAVGAVFERLGAIVIDADVISREVVANGSRGSTLLKEAFPESFSPLGLDRARLKETVFSDEEKRKKLNSITWTLIGDEIRSCIASLSEDDVAVLIVPLMFESGMNELADIVITVSASPEVRLKRLLARDGITPETALAIMNSQMSDSEREQRSDVILKNDSGIAELRDKAVTLYGEILERIPRG